jgi:hypothetical protein
VAVGGTAKNPFLEAQEAKMNKKQKTITWLNRIFIIDFDLKKDAKLGNLEIAA